MNGPAAAWAFLAAAIVSEVAATSALKLSEAATRPSWAAASAAGYGLSFRLLAQAFRHVPLSVAYAIWAGAGIALITVLSATLFAERIGPQAGAGLVLIVLGIVVLRTAPMP